MSKWSEPNNLPNIPDGLVGSKHTFPDGDSIMIFEIKLRDRLIEGAGIEGITPFIIYEIQQGPGIPRRLKCLTMTFLEHMDICSR